VVTETCSRRSTGQETVGSESVGPQTVGPQPDRRDIREVRPT
jgi:hypothetical protein